MPRSGRLEGVASVQDPAVVEADQIAGPEGVDQLEPRIARDRGEHAQRLVGTWYVGVRHVRRRADRIEGAQREWLTLAAVIDQRADPAVLGVGGAIAEDPFERGECLVCLW